MVDKITKPINNLKQIDKINEIIDNLSGTITIDQTFDPTSENAQSGVAINGAGFATENWVRNQNYLTSISSSDVIDALGYTPYNATNPNGYITASALTNYVTTDTAQDISGRKTFLGEKAIYFKQQATSNKLGFTLYNPSNTELGALEYRPNTIGSTSLLALNCPQTTGGYVGFRYWGTPAVNIVAPKVATAGNYFMATHITNGTLTVTADNQGTVNISSLLPDVSGFATETWVRNQNYLTSSALNGYATQEWVLDKEYTSNVGTVTSVNGAQPDSNGNVSIAIPDTSNLANKDLSNLSSTGNTKFQAPLVSGTSIKTINNTSLLGGGNIDTDNVYWATYGTTTFTDIITAINAGKLVMCRDTDIGNNDYIYTYRSHTSTSITFYNVYDGVNTLVSVDSNNVWDMSNNTFLPNQYNQNGKFLTTNGTAASWATITIPTPTYDSVNERITW